MSEIAWSWLGVRASGVTAWGLLTAVVIWGLLLRSRLLPKAPPGRLLHMHRWLGALALIFLFAHLGLLLVDPVVKFTVFQILVPGAAPWQPFAVTLGTIAFWLILPVSVIGRVRQKLGNKGAMLFQRSHVLAYAAWPLATGHYVLAGTDAFTDLSMAALVSATSLVVFLLLARGFVPPALKTRPGVRVVGAAPPAQVS